MTNRSSDVSHRTLLLTTKLNMPPARPELVPRPRLSERLSAGTRAGLKLTLISAPAGYGKTPLVVVWLTGTELSCTWLSLDENDNDPARFFTYLVAALQEIDPDIGQVAQALARAPQPPPPESLLTTLINDVAATSQPFALVLDDYHLIHTRTGARVSEPCRTRCSRNRMFAEQQFAEQQFRVRSRVAKLTPLWRVL